MSPTTISSARAVADLGEGAVLATVEVAAPVDRVFRALTSREIATWWVRPGVFDTREWSGDVRAGGRWLASGIGGGHPYTLEGGFIRVAPPTVTAYTRGVAGAPAAPTTVTCRLDPGDGGTRITLRRHGFTSRATCANTGIGWETSFEKLATLLGAPPPAGGA